MKFRLATLFTAISLLSATPTLAHAADLNSQDVDKLMQKITQRTQELEKEVSSLKTELRALKASRSVAQTHTVATAVEKSRVAPTTPTSNVKDNPTSPAKVEQSLMRSKILSLGGTPVISSPYIGIRSAFDGSNLIINLSDYNQDILLLRQREKLENKYRQAGFPYPKDPLIEISGKLEGQVTGTKNAPNSSSDVDLGSAELDFTVHLHRWVTGFIAFAYDNLPGAGSSIPVTRTNNSRVYLKRGFITVGNLNETPFYGTIGQRIVPFGQYNTYMIDIPLTRALTRTRARAISLGYQPMHDQGLYGSIYTFKGDANLGTSNINQGGIDLGYLFSNDTIKTDFGVDVINNIADSEGLQNTGGATFGGFGSSSSNEMLVKRVPGANVHGSVGVGPLTFFGEYTGATQAFSPVNLTYNNHGAKPNAYHVEGVYKFQSFGKPSSFALGYDHTAEALAIGLPRQRIITAYNLVIWKDTIASLQYQHSNNYNAWDTATGQGSSTITPAGSVSNSITAQFGIYF